MDSMLKILKEAVDERVCLEDRRHIDANQLTLIAEVLMGCAPKIRDQMLPLFNRCAEKIGWGALPHPGAMDVFRKYREEDLITWTKLKVAA